jgi:translation initiation factor IF-2
MSKKRVHELAKELGISSADLLVELKKLNIETKSSLSALEDSAVTTVLESRNKKTKKTPAKEHKKEPKGSFKDPQPVKGIEADKKADTVHEKTEKKQDADKGKKTEKEQKKPEIKQETAKQKHIQKESTIKPQEKAEITEVEVPDAQEPKKEKLKVTEVTTAAELASKMNVSASDLIKKIMSMGMMVTMNQKLDKDSIILIASEYGFEVEFISIFSEELEKEEKEELKYEPRPPIVTVMGHVDHGKTSLLDSIRETNVTAGEAGGITQHIGAYKVSFPKGEIVFLDTPGHEAFTAMRARGAKVTDIVVLVVAADDGVMPQTVEAIDHAKAAGVKIIVAINKIDKPEANIEKVKQELSKYDLISEEWGGSTLFAPVSAKKNQGITELLEMILLESEMLELKAAKEGFAKGVVLEAKLDKGKGPVATILVEKGVLNVGDAFVAGFHNGKVRAMMDYKGVKLQKAAPPSPVEITGFSGVPNAGDKFQVVAGEKEARQISMKRTELQREINIQKSKHISLESVYDAIKTGNLKDIKIILKGDVQGSIDAISATLEKLSNDTIRVSLIHKGVGDINESDVMLASASDAIIIGFSVNVNAAITELAKREEVDLRIFKIIYEITDAVKNAMEGLLEPEIKEIVSGRAEVKQIIKIPNAVIAGSMVKEGKAIRGSDVRVLRGGAEIYKGKITSLKRFKEDVKEVAAGYECGIGIDGFLDLRIGDVFEIITIEKTPQKL